MNHKHKALVVDDAMLIRRMLKDELLKNGFEEIVEASSGDEGLDLYKKHNPDIITMDIVMPGKDGLETLKDIMEINPESNVVMISSIGQEHFIEAGKRLGAKGHIIKPFSSESIKQLIDSIFSQ